MSATDRKSQTSTFTYDPLGRRVKAEYADGAVATFTYDTAGRLTQADDTADPHRPITFPYDLRDPRRTRGRHVAPRRVTRAPVDRTLEARHEYPLLTVCRIRHILRL